MMTISVRCVPIQPVGIDRNLLAINLRSRASRGGKTAQCHRDEGAIHRLAPVAEDRTRRSHRRAGHDQQIAAECESDRGRRQSK